MRRLRTIAAIVAMATLLVPGSAAAAVSAGRVTDGTTAVTTIDAGYALVQLNGEPLSTYAKTKPGPGKKIDFNSTTTKSYRAMLSALRNDFKKWLQANAPKAQITGSWDISLNAVGVKLNGTTLATLKTSPYVTRAEYQGLYRPTDLDPDLSLVNAYAAWTRVGGAANAGAGVKVAVIDSGIDNTHPCFSGVGYTAPAGFPKGQPAYTNNKVIVAKVFNNKINQNQFDAKAVGAHGTHVAGTIACNFETPAQINGVTLPYEPSGVAPAAYLGNYNVFPGNVENARSEDILNALDAAYADGMDVANMSLGGGASGVQDLLSVAVNDLDIANMVVAVSAGNEGDGDATAHPPLAPGHYTVGSPGSAARALTAGASWVGHGMESYFSVSGLGSYYMQDGDFKVVTSDLAAPIEILRSGLTDSNTGLSTACAAITENLTGKIAILSRGSCDFSTKIRYAELKGAVGVIVVDRVDGAPVVMGQGTSPDGTLPTIPAYSISRADGIFIRDNALAGATGTMHPPAYALNGNANILGSFSSEGPTDVDFRVKPDLVAPGVNVVSSVPGDCGAVGCWAFFSGTSMASPHLAGAAAVVRGAHPTWTAAQVRSAITNTAAENRILSFADGVSVLSDVNMIGAGLLDVDAALAAVAAIGPVSTSFDSVPQISGQTRTLPVTITNLTGGAVTWTLTITGVTGTGVSFSLSTSTVALAAGGTTTVNVTMTAAKGAQLGDHQAVLRVKAGSTTLAHAVLYTFVK